MALAPILQINVLCLGTPYVQADALPAVGCITFEVAVAEGARLAAGFEPASSSDPALGYQMYYTSGTTGFPKGVLLTYTNVCSHAHHALKEFGFTKVCCHVRSSVQSIHQPLAHETSALLWPQDDVWAHYAPMFHLVDAYAIFAITWVGGAHTFMRTWNTRTALEEMAAKHVTATHVAATMLQMLITNPERPCANLASLRLISCGGSALPSVLVEQAFSAFGPRFFTSYGMTECSGKISLSRLSQNELRLPMPDQVRLVGSQGRAFCGVELRVARDHDTSVAVGEVGEVLVRGTTIINAYWNRPDATAESFVDGWFCTGDLCTLDERGWLSLVDRKKDMILFAGENVYAAEVERVLYEHPSVQMAAVFGVPDPGGQFGELVKAVVQLKPGIMLLQRELTAFCARSLARYKLPAMVEFIDAMPLTGSGKIYKSALRTAAAAGADSAGTPNVPFSTRIPTLSHMLWRVQWHDKGPLRACHAHKSAISASWLLVSPVRLTEAPGAFSANEQFV